MHTKIIKQNRKGLEMMKQIGDIKLYSVKDLHESLGMNAITIRDWFKKGRLKGVKIGIEWHITEENLRKFLSAEEGDDREKPKKTRQLRALSKAKKKGG